MVPDNGFAQREARPSDRRCPDCGTPTAVWRGDVHKWRCLACVGEVVGLAYRPDVARCDRTGFASAPGYDAHGRPILEMNSTEPRRTK